jgi:hypothetical protein
MKDATADAIANAIIAYRPAGPERNGMLRWLNRAVAPRSRDEHSEKREALAQGAVSGIIEYSSNWGSGHDVLCDVPIADGEKLRVTFPDGDDRVVTVHMFGVEVLGPLVGLKAVRISDGGMVLG